MEIMTKLIEIKNLSFWFNNKRLFSNINLIVNKWDFIWVFWENWTWKTTLIKLILKLLKPSSWEINYFNEKSQIVNQKDLNIEYISQKAQNIDSIIPITVREIVKMWNKPKWSFINHLTQNCSYETIENSLKHVNMIDYIDYNFWNLSWWQKQRVLIAKALISNPDIIIMDEPTAWIDLIAQKHFYDLLYHLNIFHKITIILISHDTKFIQEKVKRLWYLWQNNCLECKNESSHLENIKNMFPKQKIEFLL